jgi:hypothetical protein
LSTENIGKTVLTLTKPNILSKNWVLFLSENYYTIMLFTS